MILYDIIIYYLILYDIILPYCTRFRARPENFAMDCDCFLVTFTCTPRRTEHIWFEKLLRNPNLGV